MAHDPSPRLLRLLRSWEGAAVSIGVAVGAGIFRTPGDIAGYLGGAGLILGVWLLGGLLALLDSLVIAELASRRPQAGGHYAYLREAYGPALAFVYGWTAVFLTWPASIAALADVSSDWAGRLGLPGREIGLAVLLGPAVIHAIGLRAGSWMQNLLSYGKMIALGLFAVAAFALAPARESTEPIAGAVALGGLGLALQRVMWSYGGYFDAVFMAEETREPERGVPRALFLSVGLLTLIYLLLNAAFLACLTPAEMATSKLVAGDAALQIGGPPAMRVIEILALATVLGGASSMLLSGPRISFAMARDGLLFRSFLRVSRRGTPTVGLVVMTTMAVFYWAAHTFDQLLETTIFVIWVFLTLTTIALFRLRRSDGPRRPAFLAPFYPYLPLALLAIAVIFLIDMLRNIPFSVLRGTLVMLAGFPVYLVWRRLKGALE